MFQKFFFFFKILSNISCSDLVHYFRWGATTFSITTLSTMNSILKRGLNDCQRNDTQDKQSHHAECLSYLY
jgi:hypothetical protein